MCEEVLMKIWNKTGFTLMELMAVVVIVSILAAVSVGSYRRTVERAHITEAYNVGSALLEAVNRYYYDNPRASDRSTPSIAHLDVKVAKGSSCATPSGSCVRTKHFEITVPNSSSSVVTAASIKGKYSLIFYPDFSTTRSQEKCAFSADKGKSFCMGAGYKSCGSSFCCKGTVSGSICK